MFIEPVFGKKFFGREEVLGTLQKRVTALKGGYRQNLALSGPMLTGKSSILRHFLKNIKDPDIIPLYIDMSGEDFHVFCTQFMGSLLYKYLVSVGQRPENDFTVLKKTCRKLIPETVRHIDKISASLKKKKVNDAYEKLLETTSIFKAETGKSCIVILDEFHNLSNFRLKKPFQIFGKFIMIQKNTMYVVSSSQKSLLKDILSRKLALLFGNFEVINVDGFDNQTARSFISDKTKDLDDCGNIKNYLIQVTQGNPFYLEVLTGRFTRLVKSRDNKRDAKECLLQAFSDILYESGGVLNQYFMNNINFFLERKARKKFIDVLLSLANGASTIKAIQADLGRRDKDLSNKLQRLQEMDLIWNSGVFYKISDKLFEYWLKYVYTLKIRSMIDDMDIKYLEFKHSLENDYKSWCEFDSKSVIVVIRELLKEFGGEKVCINMNCRKMPNFDSVESFDRSENLVHIVGRVQDKKWICHVKKGNIADENDVLNLWDSERKNTASKVARRVLMPLNGIEQNAFLLAKEKNIWVWDVEQINKLLRLFGKFELVL